MLVVTGRFASGDTVYIPDEEITALIVRDFFRNGPLKQHVMHVITKALEDNDQLGRVIRSELLIRGRIKAQ